jgi:hypothetical protein
MSLKQGFGKYFDNPSIEKKERIKTQKEEK